MMMSLGPCVILVDGYNVIRNIPGLVEAERLSLAHGREALLGRLVARYRHTPHRVIVVFDGAGTVESIQPISGLRRGQIVYTCAQDTADDVIARIALRERSSGAEVIVVSDDIEVRSSAHQIGGQSAPVDRLAQRLNEAPRHLRKLSQHRAYVRQQWAKDADEPYETQPQTHEKGSSHRLPRRRRGRPDVSPL